MADVRRLAVTRCATLALVATLSGCGGDGPAAPGLQAPDPRFTLTPGLATVAYDFSWAPEPGATSYLIEIGRAVGASDVLSREITQASFTITLPAGPATPSYYVRFLSRGAGGESPPRAIVVQAIDLRGVVEALFFESGPQRPSIAIPWTDIVDEGARASAATGFAPDVMNGWRAGSRVTVIASTALRDVQLQAVRDATEQFNLALGGVIRASVVTSADRDPRPRPGTITIAPGSPEQAGCGGNAIGCAVRTIDDGVILQARLVVTPGSTGCVSAHELGHGLYGFGHIGLQTIPGIEDATMNPAGCVLPRLSPVEVAAIEVAYQRGMRAGARRSAFVQAGLIAP